MIVLSIADWIVVAGGVAAVVVLAQHATTNQLVLSGYGLHAIVVSATVALPPSPSTDERLAIAYLALLAVAVLLGWAGDRSGDAAVGARKRLGEGSP